VPPGGVPSIQSIFSDKAQEKHEKIGEHRECTMHRNSRRMVDAASSRLDATSRCRFSRPDCEGIPVLITWRDRAACRGEDPELFFPEGNTAPALRQTEEAKAVCGRCEVAETCLKWAMDSGQDTGVWGGLSEGDRRALKRRRAPLRRAS